MKDFEFTVCTQDEIARRVGQRKELGMCAVEIFVLSSQGSGQLDFFEKLDLINLCVNTKTTISFTLGGQEFLTKASMVVVPRLIVTISLGMLSSIFNCTQHRDGNYQTPLVICEHLQQKTTEVKPKVPGANIKCPAALITNSVRRWLWQ